MNNEIKHNQGTVFAQKHFFLSESFFCRVFALCVFLTLSLHPITAQTNTQQSTPDYISQAKSAVKKYYPQYVDYFKPIFEILDLLDNNILDMINEKTNENINIYSSEFKNEKDKQTTVLMTLEKIIGYKKFQTAKDIVIIDKNEGYDMREGIAEEIATDINNGIKKELIRTKKLENLLYKMNKLNKKDYLTENDNEELLNILEELFNTNENTEGIKTNGMKELFKMYVKKCKDIGRAPKKEIVEWVKNNE